MNSVHNSMSRVLLNESSGIGLDMREDSDIQNSEKEFATLEKQIISPSATCSLGVALSNLEDTMKFSVDIQKLPRQMSVPSKKNLKRTEEDNDHRAASMKRGDRSEILDKSGSDHGFTREKMTSLHILCRWSETFSLRRLEFMSRFYDWIVSIKAYFALILRDPGGALLELESALNLLELRICGDLPGSLCSLGVYSSSGWKFGGWVIGRDIGCKPKRTFF